MANYSEAINDIRYLSNRLRGLIEVAEYLGDVDSLEQRVAEKTKALEETNTNLGNLSNSLNATREQLEQTREDLEALINRTNAEADAIRANAAKEAELIIIQAQYKAQDEIDKISATGNIIRAQIEDARAELKEVEDELLLKSQALANIENKIKNLRESLNG